MRGSLVSKFTAGGRSTIPGLELRGVSKTLGSTLAVRDVNLTVNDGEFFTLLGSSGSGKSTTLNLIAGFLGPDTGEIYIRGQSVASIAPERRGLGIVFQSYALFPHMSTAENVAFPLRRRGVKGAELRRRVDDALALVELEGRSASRPAQLSGGQQQRVALARALVFEPKLILLDEPLGALDRKLRQHLQDQLRELHERIKFTALYVTHDQEEALALSDRVAVMSEGKILQVASSAEIYKRPESAFVARFLGDANLIDARVVAVDATTCVVELRSGTTMGAAIPCGAAIRVGDSVQMVARPEALIVRSDSDIGAFPLLLQGRLCTRRFVGQDILAVVSTDVGADVNIRERPGGQLERLSPGSPVSVVWRAPEQASVIAEFAEPSHVAAPELDFG